MFGYIKLKSVPHLILIEEASIVGQFMRGVIYKVEKLMFVPLNHNAKMQTPSEDLPFIEMIKKVEKEKAFYFSYDIDLTKSMQVTLLEITERKAESAPQKKIMRETYPNSVDYLQ